MRRRSFFERVATGLAAGPLLPALGRRCADLYAFGQEANLSHVEARYYRKHPDREVECLLCPRLCRLGDKERGYCGVRENDGGTYYTLVYGKACSINVDPIEKKPFFHFLPGTPALSIASAGCNVNCKFCQNWEISQVRPEQVRHVDFPPEDVARQAAESGCPSIAYTYTEPVVFFEYMYDTAQAARRRGVRSVVVSGGHINPEPLRDLIKVVDAIKIDLKSFDPAFYRDYVRGELKPVLDAIREVAKTKVWLEVVYLVVPTLNDDAGRVREMSRFIRDEAGPEVPVHFSRFQPMYLVKNLPPTPVSTLERLREAALAEGLRFVYLGNVPGHDGENTFCPGCGQVVIRRFGYEVQSNGAKGGKCGSCGRPIPGVWA
jgi:pyruvate formate lyase activating enzyme